MLLLYLLSPYTPQIGALAYNAGDNTNVSDEPEVVEGVEVIGRRAVE